MSLGIAKDTALPTSQSQAGGSAMLTGASWDSTTPSGLSGQASGSRDPDSVATLPLIAPPNVQASGSRDPDSVATLHSTAPPNVQASGGRDPDSVATLPVTALPKVQASGNQNPDSMALPSTAPPKVQRVEDLDSLEEILLVDEVDVFFGDNFYGRTHNQVAPLSSGEAEQLLREVWSHKDSASSQHQILQAVKESTPYKALLNRYADFAEIVQSEVVLMCADLTGHMAQVNAGEKDYVFDEVKGRIGYKVMDGIAWEVVKGYKTAFAYLQEATRSKLPNESETLQKALVLRVPCGRFSYADLGLAKILGVSGTVEALGDYEWQVMQEFKISSYTLVPSVYGLNNFSFLKQDPGVPITISKDGNFFYDITDQVNDKIAKHHRAVIVFFRDVTQLEEYQQSEYFSKIAQKNVLLPSLMDKEKDWIARKTATVGQVTLAPAVFGRGTDFYCFDEELEKAGGIHVIQTFFSADPSEEIQIQGRTARQGKSGTYSLILQEAEIVELGLQPSGLPTAPEKCYEMLSKIREKNQAAHSQEVETRLQEAKAIHQQSHDYFDALCRGDSLVARFQLKELYKKLGNASLGGAYHVVCCYDESGSMRGSNWQALQQAHQTCLQMLQKMHGTKVSIVQFDSTARLILDTVEPTQGLSHTLQMNGGGTQFEPALDVARQQMRRVKDLTPVLVFMSDGSNGDGDCLQTVRSMQQEFPDMLFHAIIFGQTDSPRLRGMVSAATDGHFHVSADGVQLEATLRTIASGLEYTGR